MTNYHPVDATMSTTNFLNFPTRRSRTLPSSFFASYSPPSFLLPSPTSFSSYTPSSLHRNSYSTTNSVASLTQTPTIDRPKILFFGSDSFSSIILNRLFTNNHLWSLIQVVTPPISRTGRGLKQIYRPPLLDLAIQLDIPVQSLDRPDPPNQHRNPLVHWSLPRELERVGRSKDRGAPDPILITASFPYFIPGRIIQHFNPSKSINVHPSLLPAYRGPAPIQWQIAHRLQRSGITIQDLSLLGFDRGNILAQEIVRLATDIDYAAAETQLAHTAATTLCQVIENLDQFILDAKPQDPTMVSQAPKITQSDLRIKSDWTVEQVEARYRAMAHQYPLNIRVESELYQVIPEFKDREAIAKLNRNLEGIEGRENPGGGRKLGRIIYDRDQDLVGIRVRSRSSEDRSSPNLDSKEEKEDREAVLAIKSFKPSVAGGKGWITPSAWWDRLFNRIRRRSDHKPPRISSDGHHTLSIKNLQVFLDSEP